MNPNIDKEYQNIFRELKEEKMDWNFEDFLKKTEEKPEETKVIPLQKKSGGGNQKWYWMAASLVTLFGMMMFFNPDITEPTLKPIASNESNSSEKPAQTNIIKPTENQYINTNSNTIKVAENNVKPTKKINHEFRNEHQNIASQPSKAVENSTEILENPAEEYSADYVIVNGKKIYNEEEAIDITKEAFQLFASNVTKTINQAEPIKNLSINF